jgi:hypothetical protein
MIKLLGLVDRELIMSQKFNKYLLLILCGAFITFVGMMFISKEPSNRKFYEEDEKQHLKQIEDETINDLSSSKLKPHFKGVDILNLYRYRISEYSGSGNPISKGEFETTEEFNKRVKKYKTNMESEIGSDKIFAFQIANYRFISGCIQKVYDIEHGSIEIYLEPKKIYYSEYEKQNINIKCKIDDSYSFLIKGEFHDYGPQYVGQNAFGAKRVVNRYENNDYYIALFNEDQIRCSRLLGGHIFGKFPILIAMDPEPAKSTKDSIQVLAITKIKVDEGSAAMQKSSHLNPTFSNPTESETKETYIFTELIGLWIYNMDTGEIYKKIMISPSDVLN